MRYFCHTVLLYCAVLLLLSLWVAKSAFGVECGNSLFQEDNLAAEVENAKNRFQSLTLLFQPDADVDIIFEVAIAGKSVAEIEQIVTDGKSDYFVVANNSLRTQADGFSQRYNSADGGDYLVFRYGEIRTQAQWICDNYDTAIASAAELAINTREAADDPDVEQYIRDAEALFIAGGDRNSYQDTWEGTDVEDAINYLINEKKVPLAGTSAGMAILGEYYYAPRRDGVLSSEILEDPFHRHTENIDRADFIDIPFLKHTITDTHLDRLNRPQYPAIPSFRIFGFLARVVEDNGIPAYGIGLLPMRSLVLLAIKDLSNNYLLIIEENHHETQINSQSIPKLQKLTKNSV